MCELLSWRAGALRLPGAGFPFAGAAFPSGSPRGLHTMIRFMAESEDIDGKRTLLGKSQRLFVESCCQRCPARRGGGECTQRFTSLMPASAPEGVKRPQVALPCYSVTRDVCPAVTKRWLSRSRSAHVGAGFRALMQRPRLRREGSTFNLAVTATPWMLDAPPRSAQPRNR